MQDASEICHYPEIIREALRLELNVIFRLEHVTEFSVLSKRKFSLAVNKFSTVGKNI